MDAFDTNEMLFLDMANGGVKFRVIRPLRTEFHSRAGDNFQFMISTGYSGLIFEQLNHQARITDLTP